MLSTNDMSAIILILQKLKNLTGDFNRTRSNESRLNILSIIKDEYKKLKIYNDRMTDVLKDI